MDHSVKAMSPHRKVAFARLLNRHRFENDELEALFQRYMFKVTFKMSFYFFVKGGSHKHKSALKKALSWTIKIEQILIHFL